MQKVMLVSVGDLYQTHQSLADLAAIEPPTFMLMVAKYLRNNRIDVGVIDQVAGCLSPYMVSKKVEEENPSLVCVFVYGHQPSASTQLMPIARRVCAEIKDLCKNIPILITGTHPCALPERTLVEEPVDFVCDGEGFITILTLVDALKSGQDLNIVPGLWYWSDKEICHTKPALLLTGEELSQSASPPAWDLVDMKRYRAHNWHAFTNNFERQPYASIYTSFGCPFKCKFCCINAPFGHPSYRMLSPKSVIEQIDILFNEYDVKNIKIVDEMFVLNRQHVHEICNLLLEREYPLNIWAYARIDTVDDGILKKMKSAGFNWLALGIESGNPDVRGKSNKEFDTDYIIKTVELIKSHKISVLGNFIFGLPGETKESLLQTYDLASWCRCDFVNFYCAVAYPGSQLYLECLQNCIPLPKSWAGYSQFSSEFLSLSTRALSSQSIVDFRDSAFKIYFTSTEYREMIRSKYGEKAVEEIDKMLAVNLSKGRNFCDFCRDSYER